MWKNININNNQIKVETAKAVLINCPHNSSYDGYSFWHPAKLLRSGKHSAASSIGYTDEFSFKLVKYGKGKYNSSKIIDEINITVSEFEEMFGLVDENIKSSNVNTQSYLKVHEPQKIEVEIEVPNCLKNN